MSLDQSLEQRQNVLATSLPAEDLSQGAVFVFGPAYEADASAIQQARKEQTSGPIRLVRSAEQAKDLAIPDQLLADCQLVFAHYVPQRKGRRSTQRDFEAWGAKLLNGIASSNGLGPVECGHPEINWFGDSSSSNVTLNMRWDSISGSVCRRIACALEACFSLCGGSSQYFQQKRPWWKFWAG